MSRRVVAPLPRNRRITRTVAKPPRDPQWTPQASAPAPGTGLTSAGFRCGTTGSEQFGPLEGLIRQVLVEPGKHGLVPDLDVARLEHPVVLVRQVQEGARHPLALQFAVERDAL